MEDIAKRILELKKERNATIIAHNYQLPEIQDIADYLGDSLGLSRKSAELEEDVIVFCGVKFMAETAKILSPQKTVLIPDIDAGCNMAGMVDKDDLQKLQKEHPDAKTVTYVNTTAETKAYSDICCTSSNAVKVVNSLDTDNIIFVPDKNLASYVQDNTDKHIIPYSGYCYVHNQFTVAHVRKARDSHPGAVLLLHPEAPHEVQLESDHLCSTGGMIEKAGEIDRPMIIGTENEMVYRLQTLYPDKEFYPLMENPKAICTNMKKITLPKVLRALEGNTYEVTVNKDISKRALKAIEGMLTVS